MSHPTSIDRLSDLDLKVLSDVIRFGALTFEQIARRYDLPGKLRLPRLSRLQALGLLTTKPDHPSNLTYYVATPRAVRAVQSHLGPLAPASSSVQHDLTLVNLADWLLDKHPGATWRTDRELKSGPRRNPGWGRPEPTGHHPDGLLIANGRHVGIELELTSHPEAKYVHVCRWFAFHIEFDELVWYVRSPTLRDRINYLVNTNGLGADLDIQAVPIPAEVEVVEWRR